MASKPDKIRKDAMKFLAKGDTGRALEAFQQLLQLTPEDIKVWISVADIFKKTGQTVQAIRFYANAAKKYAVSGELLRAISINKMILDLDPKHKQTQKALALLYCKTGEATADTETQSAQKAPQIDKTAPISLDLEDEQAETEPSEPPQSASIDDLFGSSLDAENDHTESGDLNELISRLPQFNLFSELDESSFEAVIDQLFHLKFGPGDMIVNEDDPGESFYVICDGSARVVKNDPSGNPIELATLSAGDFFGEFAYMTGSHRTASVMANDDITLLEFARDALKMLEKSQPQITEILEQFYKKRLVGTVLKISPLLQSLDESQRSQLIRAFNPKSVGQKTTLIQQNQPASSLFLIVSGSVSVSSTSDAGEEVHITKLGVGEFFGEISLITGKNATATCITETNCRLYELPEEKFHEALQQFPEVANTLKETAKQRIKELKDTLSAPSADEQLAQAGLV